MFSFRISFHRVQSLKFKTDEQSDLNDILLRVSAFGLFVYAVFSVIAGALNMFTHEPNLLVMITGLLAILQVIALCILKLRQIGQFSLLCEEFFCLILELV